MRWFNLDRPIGEYCANNFIVLTLFIERCKLCHYIVVLAEFVFDT